MGEQTQAVVAKKKQLEDLIGGNERSFEEINQRLASHRHPPMTIDTIGPQLNLLIETLMEAGVLTEEQILDMQLKLHGMVEEALTTQWEALRNAEARAKLGVKKQPTLLGPGGQPLRSV